jgi:murein L,D-transpeptidase YcbB/YkuD
MPGWDENSIQAALNGDKTFEVRLKEPIPVLIFYSTAVILEGHDDRFFEDIYGLDADLEKALAQANP